MNPRMEHDLLKALLEQNQYYPYGMYSHSFRGSGGSLFGVPVVTSSSIPDDQVYLIDSNPEITRLPNGVGVGRSQFFQVPGDCFDLDNYHKTLGTSRKPYTITWVDEPQPYKPITIDSMLEAERKLRELYPPIIVELGELKMLDINFEPGSVNSIGEKKENPPEPYSVEWVHAVVAAVSGAAWGLILALI